MDVQQALALQHQAVERRARLAQSALMGIHERAQKNRVEATRGPVRVTLSGVGEILSVSVEGLSEETCDCIVAAIRAGLEEAYVKYEAEVRKTGNGDGLVVP